MSGQLFLYPPQQVTVSTGSLATAAKQDEQTAILEQIEARMGGSIAPVEYDEVDITYVASGNGVGEVETVVYSLASSPVKTLTLSYDSSNRLINVVAS